MKKIAAFILVSLVACVSYSQDNIRPKTISFPATGSSIISKWSQDIYTTDSLCVTCVPSTNAVYKYLRDHYSGGSGPSGSYYTKSQVDSILATLISDTLKTITTTNATPTNFDTIYIPNNYMVVVDAVLMYNNGSVKGDRAKAHREITISNVAGVYLVDNDPVGNDHSSGGTISTASFRVVQIVANGAVSFEVTGVAATTMSWTIQRGIKYHPL